MHCGHEYSASQMFEGCPSCRTEEFAANLQVRYDRRKLAKAVTRRAMERERAAGLRRYLPLLPVDTAYPFETLGAGATPLVRCAGLGQTLGLGDVYVKDESRNPTGSEKDRRACVGGNVAMRFGARGLVAAGGNMGAAAAAAGTRYGLPVVSVETTYESPMALLQVRAYGGLSVVGRTYEDRCALMRQCVDTLGFQPLSSYTPAPTGDPYSQEGEKTVAYEICEDLGWKAPDKVFVPVGQGFALSGIWAGFRDFYDLGLIDRLPAMIGVESSGGSAFCETRLDDPACPKNGNPQHSSVARHACSSRAAYKGIKAITDSQGFSMVVTDAEIMSAAIALAQRDGVFPSTTSATTIAALTKLRNREAVRDSDVVVCVITATGFKDADFIEGAVYRMPEPIPPDLTLLRRLATDIGMALD